METESSSSNMDVIYEVVKKHGRITSKKIREITGLGRTCVGKWLTKLRKEGKLIYDYHREEWSVAK